MSFTKSEHGSDPGQREAYASINAFITVDQMSWGLATSPLQRLNM